MIATSRLLGCRPLRLFLTVMAIGLGAQAAYAQEEATIRLLSDDAADACMADVACLRDLFLETTVDGGGVAADGARYLVKWDRPARIGGIAGDGVDADAADRLASALAHIGQLAKAGGLDLQAAESDEVINIAMLISDDFDRDRDLAFAELFSTVFAGRSDLYEELTAGSDPVCSSHLFLDEGGVIGGGVLAVQTGDDPTVLERCLHRQLLPLLGLRHPLSTGTDSLLNPESERETWTAIDFVLLKLLYHPLIETGMGAGEISEVFPKLYDAALR